MRGVVRARENRQRGRKQRDVARAVRRKVDEHGGVVGRLGVADIAQQLLGDRVALLLEDFEREGGVMGGERAPVVESDAWPHQEPVGQAIRGNAHGARGKAVERVRLVGGARHQAAKGELHALRAVALEDEDIERIEGEKVLIKDAVRPDLREGAALGRVRLDIVEMLEARRIFQVAEGRHAVTLGPLVGTGRSSDARCQRAGTKRERVAPRHIADVAHERVPILAAFSASHHHTVGKADAPYLGRGSCRLKRSQRALRILSEVNCGTT